MATVSSYVVFRGPLGTVSSLFLPHGSRNQTQSIKLGGKHFYLLSHLSPYCSISEL